MFRYLLLSLLLLNTLIFVNSQTIPYKYEDVTRLRCDINEISQIWHLWEEMVNNDSMGLLVVYGLEGKSKRYFDDLKKGTFFRFGNGSNYPQKLSLVYGGYSDPPKMEVWVIPKGTTKNVENFIPLDNSTVEFDYYSYLIGEYCGESRTPALKTFAMKLKQNKTLRGYVIGYGSKETVADEPPIYKNQIKRKLMQDKKLLNKLGVESSRITILFGGYGEYAPFAELWVVPEGAKPPKPTLSNKSASNSRKN